MRDLRAGTGIGVPGKAECELLSVPVAARARGLRTGNSRRKLVVEMARRSSRKRLHPDNPVTPPNKPAAPPAPLISIGAPETLVIVTNCCGLIAPTATLPKSNEVGLIKNGFTPFPVKLKFAT